MATPVIGSGFFNRSLTYLCHHDEHGAMGIVVNHCLDVGLSDMLSHLDIEVSSTSPDTPILAGGPARIADVDRWACHGDWLNSTPPWQAQRSMQSILAGPPARIA